MTRTLLFGLALVVGAASPAFAQQKALAGYTSVVVENLAVQPGETTKDFDETWGPLLHKGMLRQLDKKKAFAEIIDGGAGDPPAATGKRLILSNTVVEYSKGSRAAWVLAQHGCGSCLSSKTPRAGRNCSAPSAKGAMPAG
jgi:hypothetical protein